MSRDLAAEWRLKLLLSVALPLYFCLFYFALQRFPFFAPRTLELSFADRLVPFDPRWTVVYQSLYLFCPVVWLLRSRDDLLRYVRAFLVVTIAGFLCFFFVPVAGPRPRVEAEGLYGLLLRYDANLNAFPSLHAALTVLTFLAACRALTGRGARTAAAIWSALILYSTMATKQHYAIDVVAGVFLALAGDAVARVERSRHEPDPLVSPSRPPDPSRGGAR